MSEKTRVALYSPLKPYVNISKLNLPTYTAFSRGLSHMAFMERAAPLKRLRIVLQLYIIIPLNVQSAYKRGFNVTGNSYF